jgi:hypothetical protein
VQQHHCTTQHPDFCDAIDASGGIDARTCRRWYAAVSLHHTAPRLLQRAQRIWRHHRQHVPPLVCSNITAPYSTLSSATRLMRLAASLPAPAAAAQ